MATFSNFPSSINFVAGTVWASLSRNYLLRSSVQTTTFCLYDLASGGSALTTSHGTSFTATSTGILCDVNDATYNQTSDPHTFSSSQSGHTNVASGHVVVGETISLYNTAGTLEAQFVVPDFGLSSGSSGGGSSGGQSGSGGQQPSVPSNKKVFQNFW